MQRGTIQLEAADHVLDAYRYHPDDATGATAARQLTLDFLAEHLRPSPT